jgi:predicted RNA-binding Zn ribbon-like protein
VDVTETYDFPLLGEPLAIELANTLYEAGDHDIDFLAPHGAVQAWLGAVVDRGVTTAQAPEVGYGVDERSIVEVRDAAALTARALAAQVAPLATSLDTLNRHASQITARSELMEGPNGLEVRLRTDPRTYNLAAWLAWEGIHLLGSPTVRVRRCARPACPLLFAQQHARRRYCGPRCANADRQARFNARALGRGTHHG